MPHMKINMTANDLTFKDDQLSINMLKIIFPNDRICLCLILDETYMHNKFKELHKY